MLVQNIMSQPVVTCPINGTLDHAARLMWEFDCGVVPVVDDEGRLTGIVTDRDVCMAAYTQGKPLCEIPVTTAMSPQVIAVHANDSVESAESLMQQHQVRRLPVLDGRGHPAGIVSMNDLARKAAHARNGMDHAVVETLAAISEPRIRTDAPAPRPELAAH